MAPPSSARASNEEGAAARASFDCAVCLLPLEAPPRNVIRCAAGHVVCASCGGKAPVGTCCACRASSGRGGSSVKRPAYRERRHGSVRGRTEAAPRLVRCPADDCRFAGSTAVLLDHFSAVHRWPCTTGALSGESFNFNLQYGANVIAVDRDDDSDAPADLGQYLLLLRVERNTIGRIVDAFCIRPRSPAVAASASAAADPRLPFRMQKPEQCLVSLTYMRYFPTRRGLIRRYHQRSMADVACTDLTDGLPDMEDWFRAIVPNSTIVADDDDDDDDEDDTDDAKVRICVTISSSR